jgi:sigma-B regulation protein RsbQ
MNDAVLRRNNVKVFGHGSQPMLFAHGFGCDQNMWRFVAPAFADDYRIVLFDYVGAGKSDLAAYDAERYSSLEGYAQDVLEVCHALDLADVIFVGHSVSSVIGVLAANREPELFDRLVLIGPSPRYINEQPDYVGGFERSDIEGLLETMEKNYIGWANFLAPAIMKNPDRPELAEELETSFCSTDPVIARRFAEATFFADNRKDMAALRRPALIMQCSEDMIAPNAVGEYLRRITPGSSFRQLAATGHCPHMSHPEETIRVIREYLRSGNSELARAESSLADDARRA